MAILASRDLPLLACRNYLKPGQVLRFKFYGYFKGVATYLTIFHIGLFLYGSIQQHGYFFPAIGALKKVLEHR
jgi:hypothetical protein